MSADLAVAVGPVGPAATLLHCPQTQRRAVCIVVNLVTRRKALLDAAALLYAPAIRGSRAATLGPSLPTRSVVTIDAQRELAGGVLLHLGNRRFQNRGHLREGG
jgi:hypothetical protein